MPQKAQQFSCRKKPSNFHNKRPRQQLPLERGSGSGNALVERWSIAGQTLVKRLGPRRVCAEILRSISRWGTLAARQGFSQPYLCQ
jgi:hypothetical protein